jgi:hypothetical protein
VSTDGTDVKDGKVGREHSVASSGKTRVVSYYGHAPGRKKASKRDTFSTFGGDTVDFGVNTNVGDTVSFGLGPGYAGVELDPTVTLGSTWTGSGTLGSNGTGTGLGIASVEERRSEEGRAEETGMGTGIEMVQRGTLVGQVVPEGEAVTAHPHAHPPSQSRRQSMHLLDSSGGTGSRTSSSRPTTPETPATPATPAPAYPPAIHPTAALGHPPNMAPSPSSPPGYTNSPFA